MSKKAIIVEDAVFIREVQKKFLKKAGWEIVGETNSSQEALNLLTTQKPDLIVLDLVLTDGSGYDILKNIRDRQPPVKILVATSYSEALTGENPELARLVSQTIRKPFSEEEFAEALANL